MSRLSPRSFSEHIQVDDCRLRRLPSQDGKAYGMFRSPWNTDPYIREALKLYDRDRYEATRGWQKRPGDVSALYSALGKFSGERPRFDALPPEIRKTFKNAIADARLVWKLDQKVEPFDFDEVLPSLDRPTSAGVTWPGRRKCDVLPEILRYGKQLCHRAKRHGWRAQAPLSLTAARGGMKEADDEPKTRLIWVLPAEVIFVEALFGLPLIKGLMEKHDTPFFIGSHHMKKLARRLLRSNPTPYLGMDWSSFDATIPAWLIDAAFDILWSNLEKNTFKGEKVSATAKAAWSNVREFIQYYFINTPVRMPDGVAFRKARGIPSGSVFTQIIDSIVNWIVICAITKHHGLEISDLKVLGDDSDFRVLNVSDATALESYLTQMSETALQYLGMVLNVDKTKVQIEPKDRGFLGYQFRACRLWRPTEEWFRLLLYPESHCNTLAVSWSRVLGYIAVGCLHDAEASKFLRFYQTCYDLSSIEPYLDPRTLRFFSLIGQIPDLRSYSVAELSTALFS